MWPFKIKKEEPVVPSPDQFEALRQQRVAREENRFHYEVERLFQVISAALRAGTDEAIIPHEMRSYTSHKHIRILNDRLRPFGWQAAATSAYRIRVSKHYKT
jgi:hypothetical protein